MKTTSNSIRTFVALGLVSFALLASCTSEGTVTDTEGEDDPTVEMCPDPFYWLTEDPVPMPNYLEFPCGYTVDNNGDVTNSAFHEISWQYFLWVTEDITVEGVTMPRFEFMYNDESINLESDDPLAKTHILAGINQAGSNGIVVDENKRAVYTSMMINDIYHDFVRTNELYNPEKLRDFEATTDFENGSMSLKASWKIIPEGQDAPVGAYTKEAELYTVVDVDGNLTTSDNYTDKSKHETFTARVALVGFHIAVVVKDHPEFIWASFEHNDNAPNMFEANSTTAIGTSSPDDFTFYKAGTLFTQCNEGNYGSLTVNPDQTISAYMVSPTTNVYRRDQCGAGSETNQTNILDINTKVFDALPDNRFAHYYHEVGAVWFDIDNGHLEPNWSLVSDPSLQTGSLTLSNATIETFTQDPRAQNSCFSCHNTLSYNPYESVGIEGEKCSHKSYPS